MEELHCKKEEIKSFLEQREFQVIILEETYSMLKEAKRKI